METTVQKNPLKDIVYLSGLLLILISFSLYLLPGHFLEESRNNYFQYFWVHYILSVIYFFVLLINRLIKFNMKFFKAEIHNTFLFLILGMISCFALNKEINIFNESVVWLDAALILLSITMIASAFREKFPDWLQTIQFFVMGFGALVCLYFAVYLIPLYGIGIIGIPFLGISLHVFIPLFMLAYIIIFFVTNFRENLNIKIAFLSGIIIPLLFTAYFAFQWSSALNLITYEYNKTAINSDNIYPDWFRVSQRMGKGWINEKALKAELYYALPSEDWRFNDLPSRRGDIVKVHDPLIMIADVFSKRPDVSFDDRIKIIETTYGARHLTQQRIWSGESLFTNNIITDIQLYTKLRLAYTEKIISIENKKDAHGWWAQQTQEAIYTFSLPEGAVVSSLSLWINGIEEKGILTTKGKADSAYTTIVSKRRDPSVVHWQEGNTVTVRIFPCTPEENRKFKIGITSPLEKNGGTLVYKDIKFKGPISENATETINIRFDNKPDGTELPFLFDKTDDKTFIRNGGYEENWKIILPIEKIEDNHFSFDGNTYSISEYTKQYETFEAKNIYLDINKSWTSKELQTLWEKIKTKNVYVYNNKMIKLDDENKEEWFDKLSEFNFSMFPFQLIEKENALVISKSTETDLFLKDVENSAMGTTAVEYLGKNNKIRFFNLGDQLSPYLRTLRDFRALIYDSGDLAQLSEILDKNTFLLPVEKDTSVLINDAEICISKIETKNPKPNNAPDHLARLFSYNNILRKIQGDYFKKNYVNDTLITEAEKAYIVTPISSLIVLETQEDYDRFDIKNNVNESLKNASMTGAGSVPEPHEWALIVMACLFILYIKFKNKFSSNYVV